VLLVFLSRGIPVHGPGDHINPAKRSELHRGVRVGYSLRLVPYRTKRPRTPADLTCGEAGCSGHRDVTVTEKALRVWPQPPAVDPAFLATVNNAIYGQSYGGCKKSGSPCSPVCWGFHRQQVGRCIQHLQVNAPCERRNCNCNRILTSF
jgi:hypothetical protein